MHRPIVPTLLCATLILSGCPKAESGGKFDAAAESEAARRTDAIRNEIRALGPHPWAGEYYEGDGLGVNRKLILAPQNGCVFEWRGCLGMYDRNYGAVTESEGRLRLTFTFYNIREGLQGIPENFTPLIWGERHYLVADGGFIDFCNAYNYDPKTFRSGALLRKEDGQKKTGIGKPPVPAKYAPYLLDHPVEASLLDIVKTEYGKDDDRITLRLDRGSRSGLLPGMTLHVIAPESVSEVVKVTVVTENSCEAEMIQSSSSSVESYYKRTPTKEEMERHRSKPGRNWKFSTRSRYAK